MCVTGTKQGISLDLEVLVQQYRTILHIVNVGTHLVHAIGRLDGHDVVHFRLTETAVHQVYGFVAAVAHEGVVNGYALHLLDFLLQFSL